MGSIAAIILAAGLSSRMKRFKPLLPLGNGTVLSRCLDAFSTSEVGQIIVVTGNKGDEVAKAVQGTRAEVVFNTSFEEGMFTSVLAGIKALRDDVAGFFVLPVDIPLVRPSTVELLISGFKTTNASVVYPSFLGERGHPPLINAELIPGILSHDGTGGLRAVLNKYERRAGDLIVADDGILQDLDYPEDYDFACQKVEMNGPSPEECAQLWKIYATPDGVREHCKAVAQVSVRICECLNSNRTSSDALDLEVVRAAAMVHDLAEGEKNEASCADRLQMHGFRRIADVVRDPSDLMLTENEPITEKEIVFLADKLVQGVKPIKLSDRYMEKLAILGNNRETCDSIGCRYNRAQVVMLRFQDEAGVDPEELAHEVLL